MFTVNYHISCLDHPGHFIDSAATPRPTRPTVNCDDQWIPMDSCCYLQIGYWIYWMEIKVRFFLVMDCHAMSWVVLIADNIVIMSFCIQCLQFVWTCFFFENVFSICLQALLQLLRRLIPDRRVPKRIKWRPKWFQWLKQQQLRRHQSEWWCLKFGVISHCTCISEWSTWNVVKNGYLNSECPCFLTLWE